MHAQQRQRTITREENEGLMEAMAARVQAHPEKMRLRKALVEHPFGTIKRWFGYTYFLVKGLEKVRGEWTLITLAYNFKRVLNLVSLEKLMRRSELKKRARSSLCQIVRFFDTRSAGCRISTNQHLSVAS